MEELMKQILRESVPRLKFYTWQDCRRLVEKRLVSKKFSQWVGEVFRSVRYLSKGLEKEWSYPELVELEGLEKLRYEGNDRFMFIPYSTNLKELIVYQNIGDRHIQQLTSIQKLCLFGESSVTDNALQCFPNLTKLGCAGASEITLDGILSCTKLQSLKLNNFVGEIKGLSQLSHLKSLVCSYGMEVKPFEYQQWTQLTKLDIKSENSSIYNSNFFSYLTNLTNLSCFNSLSCLGPKSMSNLVKLNLNHLESSHLFSQLINLETLKIKTVFRFVVNDFEKLSNLTSLKIGNVYEISGEFPNFPKLKSLSHQCYHGCDFDKFSIDHLTNLTKLKYKSLIQGACILTDNINQMSCLRKLNVPLPRELDLGLATQFPLIKFTFYYTSDLPVDGKKQAIKNGFILKQI